MVTYLRVTTYATTNPLACSDQITMPRNIWTQMDAAHTGSDPMYAMVGCPDGPIGRIVPAVPSDGLTEDACRIPSWMALLLGYMFEDEEMWVSVTATQIPIAGTIVLRSRKEAVLTESPDPVAMLTDALSGSGSGSGSASSSSSWAVLCTGAELSLSCGVFDVMEIRCLEGLPVFAASILNTDVNLELVPALDHVSPPTPPPTPTPNTNTNPNTNPRPSNTNPIPKDEPILFQEKRVVQPKGYIPFSGTGYSLRSTPKPPG